MESFQSTTNDQQPLLQPEQPLERCQRRSGLAAKRHDKDKPWVCDDCGKTFPFQSVLLNHMRLHTGEKPFQCEYCDKRFAQRTTLTIHVRRHTGQRPFVCMVCGKGFACQGNLKIHERQHSGEKPYACQSCPKRFSTIGGLRTHEVTHLVETGQPTELYPCDECGKHFTHRSSVYSHKKRHEAKRNASHSDASLSLDGADSTPTPLSCSPPSMVASSGALTSSGSLIVDESGLRRSVSGKSWECRYCGKKFPYKHPLIAHERVHTGEKPFMCQYCGKHFGQQTSLIMHIRSHTGERRYKCEICEKRFIQPAALRSHMRTHTGERPFACSMCPKAFGHATSLRQHMLTHEIALSQQSSDSMPYLSSTPDHVSGVGGHRRASTRMCPECGKVFAYQSVLDAHMRVHSGEKPFQCPMCPKRFSQKATLAVHARTHTGEKPYKCKFCGRAFAQYGSKSVHEKSHMTNDLYKCPVCDKSLSSPSALHTHKKTHGERMYQCPMCPKNFTLGNYLKLHIKQVHMPSERCHQCPECGKTFAYQGSLQIHLRSHSGQKPFVCNVCSKGFASQGNLSSHLRIHTGVKPYVCKICNKAFAQRSQLNVHEFVHIEKRQKLSQFSCKFCSKKFAYASSLYIHTRLHTGEKPYKCKFCDKTFTNQGNMRVHERVHTKERPYNCVACDKGYAQRVGLKTHMKRCPAFQETQRFLNDMQRLHGTQVAKVLADDEHASDTPESNDTPSFDFGFLFEVSDDMNSANAADEHQPLRTTENLNDTLSEKSNDLSDHKAELVNNFLTTSYQIDSTPKTGYARKMKTKSSSKLDNILSKLKMAALSQTQTTANDNSTFHKDTNFESKSTENIVPLPSCSNRIDERTLFNAKPPDLSCASVQPSRNPLKMVAVKPEIDYDIDLTADEPSPVISAAPKLKPQNADFSLFSNPKLSLPCYKIKFEHQSKALANGIVEHAQQTSGAPATPQVEQCFDSASNNDYQALLNFVCVDNANSAVGNGGRT